ncbi:hypothetical protein SKAU_G00220930 [Synaphobranchus kaupii]|uniref:Uncharacterized protein n=1 Tax=Synaphobranchus kaupii TaxID=118154 RepID=A0A9Q1IVV4_SYNKA|nr:hypothetical protein SKAU_G00220930 [Synaphobranchus kaupii]
MENGPLSIPPVFKSAVETQKTQSVKRQSLLLSHSAQTMREDGDTTDQKVSLGGRIRTSGEHQPLGETTKVGKLD